MCFDIRTITITNPCFYTEIPLKYFNKENKMAEQRFYTTELLGSTKASDASGAQGCVPCTLRMRLGPLPPALIGP